MALTTTMARVRERLNNLRVTIGLSGATFARVNNLSPTVLSNSLRGLSYLGSEQEAELSVTSLLLVELTEAFAPCRLPADADDLRHVMTFVRENNISPEQIRGAINSIFGCSEQS